MRYRLALLLAALPGLAAAQRQRPAARGAASITIADVQRRIGVIADDSMLGRATPSPQLDAVAAYVAGEFHRFGLKPGGDSGTYFQHYPLEVLRFDPDSATIRITGGTPGIWRAGQDVLLVQGQPPAAARSEEHTSELQSHGLISYAVFCLKKKQNTGHVISFCMLFQSPVLF